MVKKPDEHEIAYHHDDTLMDKIRAELDEQTDNEPVVFMFTGVDDIRTLTNVMEPDDLRVFAETLYDIALELEEQEGRADGNLEKHRKVGTTTQLKKKWFPDPKPCLLKQLKEAHGHFINANDNEAVEALNVRMYEEGWKPAQTLLTIERELPPLEGPFDLVVLAGFVAVGGCDG